MGQTHSYLKDGAYFQYKENEIGWNHLPFVVQWKICELVPYISIVRWRGVNRRWRAAMDKIIREYPSGKIFDGLIRLAFKEVPENMLLSIPSITHQWSFAITGTQTLVDEIAYMYPKKSKVARDQIARDFIEELRQRFTRQFIRERVTAYNIMFDAKLNADAPMFGPRIIQVAFVCGPQRDPHELCFRLHIHNTYCGGDPPPKLGEAYSMRYIHKKHLPDYVTEVSDVAWQGDYAWLGVDHNLDIQRFFTCPAHARATRLSYMRMMPRVRIPGMTGDIAYCKHYIGWLDQNAKQQPNYVPCECILDMLNGTDFNLCEYDAHPDLYKHVIINEEGAMEVCMLCHCNHVAQCACYPEYRVCRCEELVEDPWKWQELDENVGDHLGQHIIELVIYATQRIFNEMNIDWRDFSCRKNDVEKLKKAYEDKFKVVLSEDKLANTDGFGKSE